MWHTIKNSQVNLRILAKPNAKKSAIIGVKDDRLHVSIHAKPEDGKANAELVAFFSKLLRLPKKDIILQSGETNKFKLICLPLTQSVQDFLKSLSS